MLLPTLIFPNDPSWNFDSVLRHWIKGDPYLPTADVIEYYRIKRGVAAFTQPKSICEIGVRAGYSAAAFLQAVPTARFVGFDLDEGSEGGIAGFSAFARITLSQYHDAKLVIADSQKFITLPEGPYDLVHIDGDHTTFGALHDIETAIYSRSKWILVDDYDFIKDVRVATNEVIRSLRVTEAYYIPDGHRGNVLIRNPKYIA
jgi:Methyltransferase domain